MRARERPYFGAILVEDFDGARVNSKHVQLKLEALVRAVGGHARRDDARAVTRVVIRSLREDKNICKVN